VYGIVLSGWGVRLDVPAARRACAPSAQMISYEIAMGLSIVAVFLKRRAPLSTSQIVHAQAGSNPVGLEPGSAGTRRAPAWYGIVTLAQLRDLTRSSAVGETNRAPFDLPEGPSPSWSAATLTEYSSFKFAMFYLAEYIAMINVSAVGRDPCSWAGWRVPWPISTIGHGFFKTAAGGGLLWFVVKLLVFPVLLHLAARPRCPGCVTTSFMRLGLEGAAAGQPGMDPHRGVHQDAAALQRSRQHPPG